MTGKGGRAATVEKREPTFVQTVRQMLKTPPKPHGKAKGAAPKGDPRSSGKGSKS